MNGNYRHVTAITKALERSFEVARLMRDHESYAFLDKRRLRIYAWTEIQMIVIAEYRDERCHAFKLPKDVVATDISRVNYAVASGKKLKRLYRQFVMRI